MCGVEKWTLWIRISNLPCVEYLCPQAVKHIYGDLYEITDYPARGFAFQLYGHTVSSMARWNVKLYLFHTSLRTASLFCVETVTWYLLYYISH